MKTTRSSIPKTILHAFTAILIAVFLKTTVTYAASYPLPAVSTNSYLAIKAFQKIDVYKDYTLKTRGTISPLKAYNAYADEGDTVYIYQMNSSYCKISYPVAFGRRTGYCRTGAIIAYNMYTEKAKSAGSCTVYSSYSGSGKFGTIYKNDNVYVIGIIGDRLLVVYDARSGSQAYKAGWVKLDEYKKYVNPPAQQTSSGTIYYVKTSSVNSSLILRKGPSTSYGKITTMPYAAQVKVFSISNGWAYLSYGSYTGYASASYLSKTKPSTSTSTTLSYGLYKKSSAYISCGFDGYTTTRGRHEGIDIQGGNGSAIYSLVEGVVTRVTYGYRGSSGLSTIAIYDASSNKTVVYLHSRPVSLSVGQKISKGQQIGYQDWRGCSSASIGHTHVEVVNGRATAARKSVNDYKLENSNPTSYWNSKGYTVK